MNNFRPFSRKTVLIWFALLTFGLTELAAAYPHITEKYYSTGIYPVIASILSRISNAFPFSLDDIFYISLIVVAITLTGLLIISVCKKTIKFRGLRHCERGTSKAISIGYQQIASSYRPRNDDLCHVFLQTLIRKVRIKKIIYTLINVLAVVYILFYWLWGFNYFRIQLNERLTIPEQTVSKENFNYALDYLIESANKNHTDTFNISYNDINILVEKSYQESSGFLKINYPQGVRNPKPITFSRFFAKAAISGYFGPFFNEIHINHYLLPVEYPWTLAHEKSHQFGITSEAEANFYAWIICNNSENSQIRYSANLNALFYFLYEARKLKDYKNTISKIDEDVKEDIREIINHWAKLRNKHVEKAASKANDTYLKTNKIEKGIDDYNEVVKYVTEYLVMKK